MIDEKAVRELHRTFKSPVVAFDCGRKCADLNGGVPICCDDTHLIPVLYTAELTYLRKKTDLWRGFRGRTEYERGMAADMPPTQRLARCKGHEFCERENRSFSCRTFPFYPYFDSRPEFVGLAYYWEYKGRCWILDRHDLVVPEFVTEFVRAWELIFERAEEEREFFIGHSATARRVHTRAGRDFVVIGRDGIARLKKPGDETLVRAPEGPTGPAP